MKPLEVKGMATNIINGAVDLSIFQTGGSNKNRTLHMRYGDYTLNGSAGGMSKRSEVNADIDVSISNERNAGNGAVACTINTRYYNFGRTNIASDPNPLNLTIHIYASQKRQNEKAAIHDATNGSTKRYQDVSFSYDVVIPPLTTVNLGIGRYWNNIDQTSIDDEFSGGLSVYNPNPPDYRPYAVKYADGWQSCNRASGKMSVRKNGEWVECRTQDGGTGTGNPPYIHESGSWKNARKVGQNG